MTARGMEKKKPLIVKATLVFTVELEPIVLPENAPLLFRVEIWRDGAGGKNAYYPKLWRQEMFRFTALGANRNRSPILKSDEVIFVDAGYSIPGFDSIRGGTAQYALNQALTALRRQFYPA